MKKQPELDVRDLGFVIEEAIRRLPDGEHRLAVTDYPLTDACLSEYDAPYLSRRPESVFDIQREVNAIERQYFQEINTIEKIMIEEDVPIPSGGLGSRSKMTPSLEEVRNGMIRRAYVIEIWRWYAVPWRYQNGSIYIIWAPYPDVTGKPIIHSYSVNEFLRGLMNKETTQLKQFRKSDTQLIIWESVGIIGLILLGVTLGALVWL